MRGWQKCILITFLTVYGVIPAMIFLFPEIASYAALSYALPFGFGNLKDPSSAGIRAARHVDITTADRETLGLWHILPEAALDETGKISDTDFERRLASGIPIIIYVHGSGGTRGQFNRLHMYTTLRGQQWHVIAFDYRGFGDSTGESSENNMVHDTVTVYQWVKSRAGSSPIILWGHSLGSGVAVQAARMLHAKFNERPAGLVMEGSFNNIFNLLDVAWITLPYRVFPFLLEVIKNALKSQSFTFASDQYLAEVKCGVLMLHAEDDQIVPLELAKKLFQSAMSKGRSTDSSVTLHVFPAEKKYGHNGLHRAPDLGNVVREFIRSLQKSKTPGVT